MNLEILVATTYPHYNFDPLKKNIMATPLNFRFYTSTLMLLTNFPTSYMASILGLGLFWTLSYA